MIVSFLSESVLREIFLVMSTKPLYTQKKEKEGEWKDIKKRGNSSNCVSAVTHIYAKWIGKLITQ